MFIILNCMRTVEIEENRFQEVVWVRILPVTIIFDIFFTIEILIFNYGEHS